MFDTFSTHISSIHAQIIPFIFALRRIRHMISTKTAEVLYFAYIQSRLSYMNVVWQCAPKYLIESLEIVQRKALRIVYQKNQFCRNNELYSLKILPVSSLCKMSSALLIFKMRNNLAKNNHTLQIISDRHNYPTRNRDNYIIHNTNLQIGTCNFFVRALNDFNKITLPEKNLKSLSLFKNKFREQLFNQNKNE